jgi:hypothetical protein
MSQGTYIPDSTGKFIQYSADNVDPNIQTLDDHGTFHGMGMIAAVTPESKSKHVIPCIKVTAHDISQIGRIRIQYHQDERQGMTSIKYQTLYDIKLNQQLPILTSFGNLLFCLENQGQLGLG